MIAVPFRSFKKATLVTLREGGSSYFETNRRTPYIGPNVYLILVASLNVIVAVEEE